MTDKRRTSISIDEDVYRYLSQEQVNQSGLINELVREYRKNNNRQVAALELRLQHLQDERDALQERLDRKEEQIQDIQELLNETEDTESELFQDAVEVFTTMPEEEWNADNPAVTNWAGKLDMTEQQFIERLQQQCIN